MPKDIYEMKLHEKTAFELEGHEQYVEVLRVPGGWIYTTWTFMDSGKPAEPGNGVFVPFCRE